MTSEMFVLPPNAVFTKNGHAVTTSLFVAEAFSRRHRDVLRTIKEIDCSEDFAGRNFALGSYLDGNNQARPMFEITRDGFTFLAMGFTGARAAKFKEAYIQRFNQMEAALRAAPVVVPRTIEIDEIEFLKMRAELAELKLEKVQNEKRKRRAFTQAEKATMLGMRAQGKGPADIAERLGRSKHSVDTFLRQQRR